MFIGHYAVAFAAKRAAPKTSLGTLFLSVQLLDLLWPVFLLLGLEHVRIESGNTVVTPLNFYDYPISHSFIGAVGWSIAFAFLYFYISRYKRGAWTVGLCALSHWFLDAVVHRPDLPLVPWGNIYIGLGLWNSMIVAIFVELGLFVVGLIMYLRITAAQDRIGKYVLWSLAVFLVSLYFANMFGPPPPSEKVIAIAGNASWLFIFWAYWIDRHRNHCLKGASMYERAGTQRDD